MYNCLNNGKILLLYEEDFYMDEKLYKTITFSGAANLIIGICILVSGISAGILLIISGSKLLKSKKKILL